jgi:hypothetical protein
MKTIEVSDEMYAKLIELANEMTTQDPRGTRMPHMFQIRSRKKVYDWALNGDYRIWVDEEIEIETFEDLIDYMETYNHEIPEDLKTLWEYEKIEYRDEDFYDINEFFEEYCPNLKECSYSWEYEYDNHFLTAKACQEHIDRNGYHYNQPDTYLNHAWRNPEMELLSEFLCGLVGKKMHT